MLLTKLNGVVGVFVVGSGSTDDVGDDDDDYQNCQHGSNDDGYDDAHISGVCIAY